MSPARAYNLLDGRAADADVSIRAWANRYSGKWVVVVALDGDEFIATETHDMFAACRWRSIFRRIIECPENFWL